MLGVYTEGGASMEQLTNLVISDRELASISTVLAKLMNDTNATSAMLIDKSGQVVARRERLSQYLPTRCAGKYLYVDG